MAFRKEDLPYTYQHADTWTVLPNGLERQFFWEYSIIALDEAYLDSQAELPPQPLLRERLSRQQRYRLDGLLLTVATVDEWHYLEGAEAGYESLMQGYRAYWEGSITEGEQPILQPEAAILLGFTPDMEQFPPYLEMTPVDELREVLAEARRRYANDDFLAFHQPAPIASQPDAPALIVDALRLMRASVGLPVTKGRAALLAYLMEITGVKVVPGGWALRGAERERRRKWQA